MPVNASDSPYTLALPSGTLLAARYRIDGPVSGAGAFAISYNAKDVTTGDPVIVKEFLPRSLVSRTEGGAVRPHSAEDERDFLRALRRFALEGAALAEASHPNLVRVRRVIEANDTVYLVMDHHRARALAEHMAAAGGRLTSAQAGRLVQQLLSALEPLHAESIVHRDLSPRSVHVSAEGNALLLGFSARRHLAQQAPELVPGFAAFEQYGTRDIGPWTDVYAASAILYYLLTGVTPPSALDRAAGEALVPPSTVVPGLSAGLTRLVLRGMALLPQQRPHAASEMRRQLETALTENGPAMGAAIAATPSSLSFDASVLGASSSDDDDRGLALRLAEGGIVMPASEPSTPWIFRKLGTALRRAPSAPDSFETALVERTASAPLVRETFATQAAVAAVPVPPPATAPVAAAPAAVVEALVATATLPNEPTTTAVPRDVGDTSAMLSVIEAPPAPQPWSRSGDIADQIALAAQELQLELDRPQRMGRYRLVAAGALVLGVGGALVLLTRSGGASSSRVASGASLAAATTIVPTVKPASPVPLHESVESGAVQQNKAPATAPRTQSDRSERSERSVAESAPAAVRPVATATASKNVPSSQPTGVLPPAARLPNLNISVSTASDTRIFPPELLVDAKTRLTNGQDLVEQGDYQVARRSFRTALTQLDSIGAKYPEAQSIRSLRRDIEQADSRAMQACGAENDMRKRRGAAPRACQ